jgi:flagellar biosynthesis GTPase FlhF
VPLRSVEAASRDDAIAAAREQFGPHARIVGVRRVRSGGVLGFFATERYVAEVAETSPDTAGRPVVSPRTRADDATPADFSSPLASAAPARARAAAPARNGAAAWAA